jgi:hypothetical protein
MHHGSCRQSSIKEGPVTGTEMLPVTHERSGDLEAAFSDGPAG